LLFLILNLPAICFIQSHFEKQIPGFCVADVV